MSTSKQHSFKLTSSGSNYSLRQRMLTRTALLLCSVLAILSVGVWHYANATADYSYDRLLSSASVSMLDGINVAGEDIYIDLPYSAFEILQLAPNDKVYYAVYGPNNEFLTGYADLPKPSEARSAKEQPPVYFLQPYKEQKVRFIEQSKRLSERSVAGDITIVLGQTTKARDMQMRDTLYAALTTLMVVMGIALFIMWIAINRALSPINWLSKQLSENTALEEKRLPDTNILEVQPLTFAINNYRHQWLDALATMRDFISDASHQIRTAQATTKAQLEIALSTKQPTINKSAVQDIYHDHAKLTRLTNQLLAHATVVHRGDLKHFDRIDLQTFLRQVLTEAVRDYAHVDIEFELMANDEHVWIKGDPLILKEALRNIIDNGITHGISGGVLRLSLAQHSSIASIKIEDAGPGIPSDLRDTALMRFQQVGTDSSGSGLGLAIAQKAVTIHKGTLHLLDSTLGGLLVELRLPMDTGENHV